MEDGTRLISLAEIESTTGPPAIVEARGLLSAALKIDPRLSVDRERIHWRLARAVMLLERYIDSRATE